MLSPLDIVAPENATTDTLVSAGIAAQLPDTLRALFESLFALPVWQGFILSMAVTLVGTFVIGMGLLTVARRLLSRTDDDVNEQLFDHLHRPTYLTGFLIGLYISTLTLSLPPAQLKLVEQGVISGGVVLWAQAVWRVGQTMTEVEATNRYFDEAFMPIFNNLWKVGVVGISGFILLTVWGIDVTPLLASAGVMGIAVGFAAKDTIANFFGGVALYFDNTYQKGDYIVLESGQEGTVIDVGIRSTVLLTRGGIRITVPNSVLNSALVINESAPQNHRRVSIPVSVAYGEDIEHVREVLLDVAENEDLIRSQPPTRVRFLEMDDFSLNIELQCWIDRPSQRIKLTDSVNTAIYTRFNEEDIDIPFPQRDIHLHHDDAENR